MALRKFLILRRPPTGPRRARPEDRLPRPSRRTHDTDPSDPQFPDRLAGLGRFFNRPRTGTMGTGRKLSAGRAPSGRYDSGGYDYDPTNFSIRTLGMQSD